MPGNVAFVPVEVGFIVDVTIPDPGANTQFTYTFPDGYLYKVDLLYYLYTADVNAGNRALFLVMDDAGANVRSYFGTGYTITANQVHHLTYSRDLERNHLATYFMTYFIPDVWIPGGWVLRSETMNMQAGDTYTNIRLNCRRYRVQN